MEDKIHLSYISDEKYIKGAFRTTNQLVWIFYILFVISVTLTFYQNHLFDNNKFIILFFPTLLIPIIPRLIILYTKRPDNRSKEHAQITEWWISQDKLECRSTNSSSELKWSIFTLAILRRDGVSLHTPLIHWFPRSAFASEEEYQKFVGWAKTKVRKFSTYRL